MHILVAKKNCLKANRSIKVFLQSSLKIYKAIGVSTYEESQIEIFKTIPEENKNTVVKATDQNYIEEFDPGSD